MKTFELKGSARTEFGKKAATAMRKESNVPCVLYGVEKGKDGKPVAVPFTVKSDDLRKLVYTPHIYTVILNIGGKECKAIMKEIQFHPVKDTIMHIDFYQISEDKPIIMEVPIATEGLAEGVKAGGKLQLQIRKLKVRATYDKIPEKLTVNVSKLGLGKVIKVGDLHFDGLELINSKDVVVCAVRLTRAAQGSTADTAAAPAAESDAAAPAAK